MAGKPLHELRRAAAQARVKPPPAEKAEAAETPIDEKTEVVKTPPEKAEAVETPIEKAAEKPEKARSLNEILSDAKMRAARGEENEDILAMVKSLKGMLRGD